MALVSCKEMPAIPKPRTYPRVEFPAKKYKEMDAEYCPFRCEIPVYSEVQKDSSFFDEKPLHECWFDLNISSLKATIYCSYSEIHSSKELEKAIRDAFTLAHKHQQKANYLDEIPYKKSMEYSGMIFDLEGHAASPFQFYMTDSARHFFRGSLYFHSQTQADSLAPISSFLKEDIIHLMNSLQWK